MRKQDAIGKETIRESNEIVYLIEAIKLDFELAGNDVASQFKKYGYDIDCHDNSISGTSTRLLTTFRKAASRKGLQFEYKNPYQLARRIKDAEAILMEIGVCLTSETIGHIRAKS